MSEDTLSRDPREHPWCYWGADPWPAGVQTLSWFKTPVEMLRWLADEHTRAFVNDEDLRRETQQHLSEYAQSLASKEPSPEELRSRLPSLVADEYLWTGTFTELSGAEGEQPQFLVEEFLSDQGDGEEVEVRAIRDDELDAFVEFVQSYGY